MNSLRRALATSLALILATAACGGGGGSAAPSGSPAGSSAPSGASVPPDGSGGSGGSGAPSGSPAASAARSPGPDEFVNPVYDQPLADPFVLEHEGTYYAYGTKAFEATEFAAAKSTDLVNWEPLPDPLRALPSWSDGRAWAPEVFAIGDRFVMYYSARARGVNNPNGDPAQCGGVAVADSPEGPFEDSTEEPFVCQPELGGTIDATHFRDLDGKQYLIWKNDGNCCSQPTRFYLQELSEDGLELVGEVTELGIRNDRRWEGAVIEAPTLLERDGTYYMFYSGGHFESSAYAVGFATSDNVRGPYKDSPENPILATKAPAAGPGHQSIFADKDGDLWMAYHAWDIARIGEKLGGQRRMWLDELVFEDGTWVVQGPDVGPQPIP